MKKLTVLMMAAVMAVAQDKGGPAPLAPGEVVRVVNVKNGDAGTIYNNLGRIFPGIAIVGANLIVRGQPAVVDAMEEAIKKLDVPSPESQPAPNVELTVQLVLGSAQDLPTAKVPSDLEATVRQLRTLFPYKSYRVLDTWILQGREDNRGGFNYQALLPGSEQFGSFQAQRVSVSRGPAPRTITLQGLQASFGRGASGGSIMTSIDAREGQKTVIGKANIANSEDAIILVITPKVIQ